LFISVPIWDGIKPVSSSLFYLLPHYVKCKPFHRIRRIVLNASQKAWTALHSQVRAYGVPASAGRQVQRFFADFSIDKDKIAAVLFSLLPCQYNLMISIDRTNWSRLGGRKADINIFVLSLCYEGIAFPLL
jgi:hypothetical protein